MFMIETLLYLTSDSFIAGVFGFGAVDYIFNASLDTGFAKISIVVLLWGLLCAFCYFKQCSGDDRFSWGIYVACIVMFLSFGLSMWHPQWLLMAIPFLTLGMFFNQDMDIYLLLDLLLMALFTLYVVNTWTRGCDQNLFNLGIFARYTIGIDQNITMSDLLVLKDTDLIFSLWAAVLLSYVVYLHPKKMCLPKHVGGSFHKSILRLRYIGGCCIFILPSVLSVALNMILPNVVYASGQDVTEIIGAMQKDDVYEQVFTMQRESVTGIAINMGTYQKENGSILKCELIHKNTNTVCNTLEIDTSDLVDNQYTRFEFEDPTKVIAGETYAVRISGRQMRLDDTFALYRMGEKPENNIESESYAIINGIRQNYDLAIMVYGK